MYASIDNQRLDHREMSYQLDNMENSNRNFGRPPTCRRQDSLDNYSSQSSHDPMYATIAPRPRVHPRLSQEFHDNCEHDSRYANINNNLQTRSHYLTSSQANSNNQLPKALTLEGQGHQSEGQVKTEVSQQNTAFKNVSPISVVYPQQMNYRNDPTRSCGTETLRSNSVSGGTYGACQNTRRLSGARTSYSQGGSPLTRRTSCTPVNRNSRSLPSAPSFESRASVHTYRTSGFSLHGHRMSGVSVTGHRTSLPARGANKTSNSLTSSVTEGFKFGMKELVRVLYMPFVCCRRRVSQYIVKYYLQ